MPELLPWHQDTWQQWLQRRAADRLPHALLLSGPEGLGKRRFADYLSQSLVCQQTEAEPCGHCQACQLVSVGNHPDIITLAPEETGKLIKVDAIRQLIHQASLTAPTWRVFIVQPADAMNIAASNALLKTLEEPTPNTLIILISAMPQRLPATIRSRCQNINFKPVAQQQALDWLNNQQADVNWPELLAYVGNQPLRAIQAHAEGWLNDAQQTLQALLALQASRANPVQVASTLGQRSLPGVLQELHCISSDLIHHASASSAGRLFFPAQQTELSRLAERIDQQKLFGFIQTLYQAQQHSRHNLNPVMQMEKLVADWLQLQTSQG